MSEHARPELSLILSDIQSGNRSEERRRSQLTVWPDERRNPDVERRFDPRNVPAGITAEIQDLKTKGLDIERVENTFEPAYDRLNNIRRVKIYLDEVGQEYATAEAQVRADFGRRYMGSTLLGRMIGVPPRVNRDADRILEIHRRRLMYDVYGGTPWHEQRGSATALLTIQMAHKLKATNSIDGEYPTMSAVLEPHVVKHVFGSGSSLAGMSLRQALIDTRQRFDGKSAQEAADSADKKLARLDEFTAAPISQEFKAIVGNCFDGLGIRSRKEIVGQEIADGLERRLIQNPNLREYTMLSVGCGTALPMLEIALQIRNRGIEPRLILLDQDPIALACAVQLAERMGLADAIEIHCERLFSSFGKPLNIQRTLEGRQPDVIEDSGLREYLPDSIFVNLAKASWRALAPGGIMTSGNMNRNRPQSEFLHGLMGWSPTVQMRGITHCIDLHQQAGIPLDATKARVTQEGVYTIYVSTK